MPRTVSAPALHAMLTDGGEIALLDVREEGVFCRSHILRAVPAPLSRLELRIKSLVPRPGCRIVLCDGGDEGLAPRAARRLAALGYGDVAVLARGVAGWADAGFELFAGVNVPSKAFGEFVEHRYGTPHIDARTLARRIEAGEDIVILDSRPMDEFARMSIPGGTCVPGAELVYRVHDLAPSPETTVVVNCAGRTRSIIGAQSLINAGIPNPVVALENGTMGWHLAGLALDHGQTRAAPDVTPEGRARARAAAERVARRFGVRRIDGAGLARFRAESGARSLYLFDVRDPREYLAGHLAGARSAPGGQLVQATDRYVGTLGARLVLIDPDGARAIMTASWLLQMGWRDVFVLDPVPADAVIETGPEIPPIAGLDACRAETVAVADLASRLAAGAALVVDLATSLDYRDGHIPGAWFAVRSRFESGLAKLPPEGEIVLTSPDGVLARLAVADARAASGRPVRALAGGTAAWTGAGLALERGFTRLADETDDVWYRPYDKDEDVEAAMQAYLDWEVALVDQVARDGTVRFTYVPLESET